MRVLWDGRKSSGASGASGHMLRCFFVAISVEQFLGSWVWEWGY